MYYVDFYSLFSNHEKDWKIIHSEAPGAPHHLFLTEGAWNLEKLTRTPF